MVLFPDLTECSSHESVCYYVAFACVFLYFVVQSFAAHPDWFPAQEGAVHSVSSFLFAILGALAMLFGVVVFGMVQRGKAFWKDSFGTHFIKVVLLSVLSALTMLAALELPGVEYSDDESTTVHAFAALTMVGVPALVMGVRAALNR